MRQAGLKPNKSRPALPNGIITIDASLIQPGHRIHCSDCVHDDALTCLAEEKGMSRFNALITFGVGDIDECPGRCTCPCHRPRGAKCSCGRDYSACGYPDC